MKTISEIEHNVNIRNECKKCLKNYGETVMDKNTLFGILLIIAYSMVHVISLYKAIKEYKEMTYNKR